MFQLLRRVSSVFLLRPDRPWRDDATSNAPTIGHKRKYSVTEEDDGGSASPTKRTRKDPTQPDTECDSPSGEENPKVDADAVSPAEGHEAKEVTKEVKEVDIQDKDTLEDASSICPEGVPLPDSPSGSPEPESESDDTESTKPVEVEESQYEEHADVEDSDDEDSLASSVPEDIAEKETEFEAKAFSTITDTSADKITPVQEITIAVRSSLLDTPETVEVKA